MATSEPEVAVGDLVYVSGPTPPEQGGVGLLIGFRGLDRAVIQWGVPGAYTYADVPLDMVQRYDRRRSR